LLIIVLFLAAISGYFYMLPNITVVNYSGEAINKTLIYLPNNRLNFGKIEDKQQNKIGYSLEQNDGSYRYVFTFTSGKHLAGECGYITANEVHKRLEVTIDKHYQVTCSSK